MTVELKWVPTWEASDHRKKGWVEVNLYDGLVVPDHFLMASPVEEEFIPTPSVYPPAETGMSIKFQPEPAAPVGNEDCLKAKAEGPWLNEVLKPAAPSDNGKGLYNKFIVKRVDGKSEPGEKHYGCEYFVLDLTHDKFAQPALRAYADACAVEYPKLSADLRGKLPEPAAPIHRVTEQGRVEVNKGVLFASPAVQEVCEIAGRIVDLSNKQPNPAAPVVYVCPNCNQRTERKQEHEIDAAIVAVRAQATEARVKLPKVRSFIDYMGIYYGKNDGSPYKAGSQGAALEAARIELDAAEKP